VDTIIDNEDKALKLSFAEEKYDEQEDYIYEQLQEKAEILDTLKEIYSWFALQFLKKLPEIAANAILDACTGSNPRQPSQEEMEKLLKCCYYDTEVDF
jgi:alcohol dehydrogenase class IV